MKRKLLAIDYLRGLSILSIILLHIILPMRNMPPTEYSSLPVLFTLRDLLNLSIVTLIACSGFSLFLSTAGGESDIRSFYAKRLKRLVFPWLNYVIISFLVYAIMSIFFPGFSDTLFAKFPFLAIANVGGIPIAWITLKWIVMLLVILTLLFPLLKYIYVGRPSLILAILGIYLAASVLLRIYPTDYYQYGDQQWGWLNLLLAGTSFVAGWSLVYIFGFSLDKLYNGPSFMKSDMKVTFISILVFVAIYTAYRALGIDTSIHVNKFPPSPYFLSLGIAATLVLLSVFISFKPLFRAWPRHALEFASVNSYWLYLWSLLTLFILHHVFSLFGLDPYIKLPLEFLANIAVLYLIIRVQRMIGIRIYIERQNF
jgi:hypothetical protein